MENPSSNSAPALAAACGRFQAALEGAAGGAHPTWLPAMAQRWPFLSFVTEEAPRARLLARALAGAGLPDPLLLAAPDGQLACMAPGQRMRSLCVLALARRPGVLRCCVEKESRVALKGAVGDAAGPLAALSDGGRAVPHHVTTWTPQHWACTGFLDWCELPAGRDRLLRRLVGVSLPRGLLDMTRRRRAAPPDCSSAGALAALSEAGGAWPC
jgi:hypothetical protein